jgi:hypothetical protein
MIRRLLLLTVNAGLIVHIGLSSSRIPVTEPPANTGGEAAFATGPLPAVERVRAGDGAFDLFDRTLPSGPVVVDPAGNEGVVRLVGVISGTKGAIALVEYGSERARTRVSLGQMIGSRRVTEVSERSIRFESDGVVETIYLDPKRPSPQ